MLTSRTTRWVAGTTLLCLVLLAAAWLLLISPRRAEASELREANVAAQEQNDLLEIKIAQLRAQFADLPQKQAELADILAQLPPDAGLAGLVRDLDAMAKATGVRLDTVTPGSPQALGAEGEGAAASPKASPKASAGASTGASAGSDTVVQIPVSVVIAGDYFQTVAFLKQLQTQMPRAFLVTTVQMAAGSGSGSQESSAGEVQVTIDGSVFALPGLASQTVPAAMVSPSPTPASPMGGGTATPSPSGTASATSTGSSATSPTTSPTTSSSLETS